MFCKYNAMTTKYVQLSMIRWEEDTLRTDLSVAWWCLQDIISRVSQIYTRYSLRCVVLALTFDLRAAHLSSNFGSPFVPTHINQLTPSDIFFHVEVQARNSKDVIRTVRVESHRHILVDENFWVGLTPANPTSTLRRRGQRVTPGNCESTVQ